MTHIQAFLGVKEEEPDTQHVVREGKVVRRVGRIGGGRD
jgi:hypothetical protein